MFATTDEKEPALTRRAYSVDVMLGNIMTRCRQVHDRQKSVDISAFTDDFRFRNLVTEMLDVKLMAKSKLLVWMQDSSLRSDDAYAYDLQFCHRRWLSLLRNRIAASGSDSVQRCNHAVEYLLTKGLLSVSDPSQPMNGELPVTIAACEGWSDKDIDALCAAGGFIASGMPVYWASYYGNSQTLTAMLKHGGDANEQRTFTLKYIDQEYTFDEMPMHVAAQTDQHDCLKLLAQHGGSVGQFDNFGRDALFYAAEGSHIKSAEVLLDLGASPLNGDRPAFSQSFSLGQTAVLSLFLDRFKIPDDQKASALWQSAARGHAKCVQVLLLARANVSIRHPKHGTTPLEIAAENGHSSCVELLQQAT